MPQTVISRSVMNRYHRRDTAIDLFQGQSMSDDPRRGDEDKVVLDPQVRSKEPEHSEGVLVSRRPRCGVGVAAVGQDRLGQTGLDSFPGNEDGGRLEGVGGKDPGGPGGNRGVDERQITGSRLLDPGADAACQKTGDTNFLFFHSINLLPTSRSTSCISCRFRRGRDRCVPPFPCPALSG